MALALAVPSMALAQTDVSSPVDAPEHHDKVYTTWDEGDRLWRDFYWYVPEGGSDANGICVSQSFSTFNDANTPEARGSQRLQPNSFCNRDDFGTYTPGRAPWDRTTTIEVQSDHTESRPASDMVSSDDSGLGAILDGHEGKNDDEGDTGGDVVSWFCGLFSIPGCGSRQAPVTVTPHRLPVQTMTDVIADLAGAPDGAPPPAAQSTFVSLLVEDTGGGTFYCAGTLVNRRQIVTSAVCFEGADVASVTVLLDDLDASIAFPAMSVTVHPGYDNFTFENNLALVTLATSQLWTEVDEDDTGFYGDEADWIDSLDPFVERHALAGDGYWHDDTHWVVGDIPENDAPDGTVIVTDFQVVPELYEVHLDAAGTTIVQQDEHADAVYVFEGATLEIEEAGSLFLDTGLGLSGGAVQVDGFLIGQTLQLQSGRFTVGETGLYYDFSPFGSGGTVNSGAQLEIRGDFMTDWLHQTDGLTYVAETGVYFDWNGALIEGGDVVIDGVFDTAGFLQTGGTTFVRETGTLYDFEGDTQIVDSILQVDGVLDTLELFALDATLHGNGEILAPLGVYQLGGMMAPGLRAGGMPGDSLTIDGDYYLMDGALSTLIGETGTNHLNVTGEAGLEGYLHVNFYTAPLRNEEHVFLNAQDGIAFLDLDILASDYSPFIGFDIVSDETSAALRVVGADYGDIAETDQQRAVASALMTAYGDEVPTGALRDLAMTLDYLPSAGELRSALQSLNPSDAYGADRLGEDLTRRLGDTVANRLVLLQSGRHGGLETARLQGYQLAANSRDNRRIRSALKAATDIHGGETDPGINDRTAIYVAGEYAWGDTVLPNGRADLDRSDLIVGLDHEIAPGRMLGANLTLTDYTSERAGLRIEGEGFALTGYGGFVEGPWYGSGYLGYSQADFDLARTVAAGAAVQTLYGETGSDDWHAGLDIGAGFDLGALAAGPVLTVRHGESEIDAYREDTTSLLGADMAARGDDRTFLGLGARAATRQSFAGGQVHADAQLTWQQDVSAGEGAGWASLHSAPDSAFAVVGPQRENGFASLAVGLAFDARDNLSVEARFQGDFDRADGDRNSASLALSWRF